LILFDQEFGAGGNKKSSVEIREVRVFFVFERSEMIYPQSKNNLTQNTFRRKDHEKC
jgi:hypothetical protein